MASDKPTTDDNRRDPMKPDSEESPLGSTPDGDIGDAGYQADGQTNPTPDQRPKRKGGRKPIYATTEERKQRNRQAQAAFRERRTEYIKQLEQTISVQEQTLINLNSAHRTAADECLMLRYKNSLLERILLEKGIDVQAELQAKHGSPNFGPTHMSASVIPPPHLSRTLLNRHHRRSGSRIAPKLESAFSTLPPIHAVNLPAGSPKSQRPTPSSHAASPTGPADGFGPSPTSSEAVSRGPVQHGLSTGAGLKQPGTHPVQMPLGPGRMMPPLPTRMGQHTARMGNVSAAPFYQTPAYQNHLDQLEQEYDAAADMMEEGGDAEDNGGGPGPYLGGTTAYGHAAAQQQMNPTRAGPVDHPAPSGQQQGQQSHAPQQQQPHGMSMTQLLDPSMDWDPFGLSASMAFPSSFSFDTSNMR